METLEELKAIRDNAPEGATGIDDYGDYIRYELGKKSVEYHCSIRGWWEVDWCDVWVMRPLSDIKRLIELEERLNNSEPKKEECKHLSSTASYTHVTCDSCYMIRTDCGWGCASRKWFDNIESAKFYEKNGFLPR